MNESDWLASEDAVGMIQFLHRSRRIRWRSSRQRRARLFICGCFRQLWDYIDDPRSRGAVEMGERLADDTIDMETIYAAMDRTDDSYHEALSREVAPLPPAQLARLELRSLVCFCLYPEPWKRIRELEQDLNRLSEIEPTITSLCGATARSAIVRDLYGNPFSQVVPDSTWLDWNGAALCKMARTIHDEYRFEDLPVLADALEDAGCTESELLDHCRSAQPHVRGCWAVDLLLGKG